MNTLFYWSSRISLSFVWIFTGLTSIFFAPEIGKEILANANITGFFASLLIWAGGLADIILGVWLLLPYKLKICLILQITLILLFTTLICFIAPEFWLHPFGPMTKNLPILVLSAYLLYESINQQIS